MIARSYIVANLSLLNRKYLESRSAKESLLYSKLAILELCGWIEESMDDIILRCSVRNIRASANREYTKEQVVNKNYGFEYEKHFRKMLIQLVGIVNVEKIEKRVDISKMARLKATLDSLKTSRNTEAHTHLRGVTRHINAPSVTRSQFNDLYEGLSEYDRILRSKRF